MSAQKCSSGTLVVNTSTPTNFPDYFPTITIVHRGSTGTIWVRTDGQEAVIAEDDNYPVLPGERVSYRNANLSSSPNTRINAGTTAFLVSDTAIPYTVYCF